MASPRNRKRQRADGLSQGQPADDFLQEQPPTKKIKSRNERRIPWNHPPGFYDNLSKVWLTHLALRELDRRNQLPPLPEPSVPTSEYSTNLARFARYGGPDLRHLRGRAEPKGVGHTIASSRASQSSQSRQTQSTKATSEFHRSRKSSAYDRDFEQHLINHNVYPEGYEHPDGRPTPEPNNLGEIRQLLSRSRSSLSPSQFPESAFEDFRKRNRRVTSEQDVMVSVVPVICGDADIPSQQNVTFTELDPVTNKDAVKPKPDLFDGVRLQVVDEKVRDQRDSQSLYSSIIPTKHPRVPVAPNFFLEAKGPAGNSTVAQRQALYDGAYGTRAMHKLQNYGQDEPVYDGNAYAYSSTYTGKYLELYAHHATAPIPPEKKPEYHMTQLDGFVMTGNRESFVAGAGAFRNLRDVAAGHRDEFIRVANTRARHGQDDPP